MNLVKTITVLATILLFGCAISVKDGDDITFKNYKIISEFNAKLLPREQRLARITSDMKKIGFNRPRVSQVFDTFSDSVLNIFRHQQSIMAEHKTLLDNHRDVLSFLMANKDKDETHHCNTFEVYHHRSLHKELLELHTQQWLLLEE